MISSKIHAMSGIMIVMSRAVLKASKSLLRDFSELEHLQVSYKNNNDFVTNADINADRIIRSELMKARPEYSLISEEGDEIHGEAPFRWIIDPLDGTANFMHSFPNWAISIALEDRSNNEIIAGITYDPIRNEMYMAEKGRGVFMNDMRLRFSARKKIPECLCAIRSTDSSEARIACSVMRVRKIGSTTLNFAYTAAGRYDIFLPGDKSSISLWDSAAGVLFIKEAGGVMADSQGRITDKFSDVSVITNIDLLPQVIKLLYK